MPEQEIEVCRFDELDDPGSREFRIGTGDWPLKGFVIRRGDAVFAYQNVCPHAGHALNWKPDRFLTPDGEHILCASHGAAFIPETGECVAGPCPGRHLTPVSAVVREGRVYVTGPDTLLR